MFSSLVSDSFSVVKNQNPVFDRNDSLATRAKKLKAIKETPPSSEKARRIQIKEVKTISEEPTNHDVQFLIQVILCSVCVLTFPIHTSCIT